MFIEAVGATFFSTSAKNNVNIEELFLDLSERMIEASEQSSELKQTTSASRRNVVVVDQEQELAKQTCC